MKKKEFLISVLAVSFFVLSGVSVSAANGDASSVDLKKAVVACQHKVRELERKFSTLEGERDNFVCGNCGQVRDAEGTYGSAYYGYLLDN